MNGLIPRGPRWTASRRKSPMSGFVLWEIKDSGGTVAVCYDGRRARLAAAAPILLDALLEVRSIVASGSEVMALIDEACAAAGIEAYRTYGEVARQIADLSK